ncbi:hypothetical protein PsYK624_137670 [Phanerochaete sordida]|uniref:Uncharacterized protein n=1 Tax=Phanerochaete sordida TaxID=48140 RepID=A0A9P3GMM3_9APHY|nr:hypothetical protein PsYK624_137670 [Phanerochaete sordida]
MGQLSSSRRKLDGAVEDPPPHDQPRISLNELDVEIKPFESYFSEPEPRRRVRMGQRLIEIDEPPWIPPNYEVIEDTSEPIPLSPFVNEQHFALSQNWGYFGHGGRR